MAEPVNLRAARKRKAREAKAAQAAENRRRFGRPAGDRQRDAALRDVAERRHEGHRLDRPDDAPGAPSEPPRPKGG